MTNAAIGGNDAICSVEPIAKSTFVDRACAYYIPIVFVTIFAKFSVPPFAAKGIALSVGAHLATAMFRAVTFADVQFSPVVLALFLIFLVFVIGAPALHGDIFSLPSVAMLITLYFPFVLTMPRISASHEQALKWFLDLCTLIAVAGILQYLLQGHVSAKYLFPIDNFLPDAFRVSEFATDTAITYHSDVYRVNGIFLLEPSFFSQLMAVAIVGELCTGNRSLRLLSYFVAMVFSYSGTGILVLAVSLPVLFFRRRRFDLLIYAGLLGILLIVLSSVVHMDTFVARAGSFTSNRSSAFARFVGGFYLLSDLSWPDTYRTLFGFGPGAFADLAQTAHVRAAEMTLFKSLVEYGVVGSMLFFCFVFAAIFSNDADMEIKIAVSMTLLLNGSYTAFFQPLALALLIWPRGRGTPRASAPRGLGCEAETGMATVATNGSPPT